MLYLGNLINSMALLSKARCCCRAIKTVSYLLPNASSSSSSSSKWATQNVTGVGYSRVTLTWGITRLQKICTEPYLFPVFAGGSSIVGNGSGSSRLSSAVHEQRLPARASSCVSIDVRFTGPSLLQSTKKSLQLWQVIFPPNV